MDTLDRQPGEKFHTWAKRIQECMNFYYFPRSHALYPKSCKNINDYIVCIRYIRTRSNLNRCYYCKKWIDHGHDWKTRLENDHLHYKICPINAFHNQYTQNAIIIQKAFKSYITRKKFLAFLIIQRAILAWLYRPNGPIMKKAE